MKYENVKINYAMIIRNTKENIAETAQMLKLCKKRRTKYRVTLRL